MPFMNKVQLIGHLGHSPSSKVANNGNTYVTFSLAVSEFSKKQDGTFEENTNWFDCACWDKFTAEKISKAGLAKGAVVYVSGAVSCRAYTGNDGSAKCSMSVNVKEFLSFEKKPAANAGNGTETSSAYQSGYSNPYSQQNSYQQINATGSSANAAPAEMPEDDDGLPF